MILGLDISTSITGVTILDSNGHCLENQFWDTRNKNKFPTIYKKAMLVYNNLRSISMEYPITQIFIEQSLHSFRSGFSSAQTLSTLSRFNGIVSWHCYQIFKIEPEMISAATARKTVGIKVSRGENAKQKSFDFVVANEPTFVVEYTKNGNVKPGIMDKSDSWVIAKAGYDICIAKN
tara:strand:- start:150 stop:680 length:531 start_codon:yes stop_codon:yes gene_type:complete